MRAINYTLSRISLDLYRMSHRFFSSAVSTILLTLPSVLINMQWYTSSLASNPLAHLYSIASTVSRSFTHHAHQYCNTLQVELAYIYTGHHAVLFHSQYYTSHIPFSTQYYAAVHFIPCHQLLNSPLLNCLSCLAALFFIPSLAAGTTSDSMRLLGQTNLSVLVWGSITPHYTQHAH